MSTTPATTLTVRPVRLALHRVCCARCNGIVPPAWAERTPSGDWRCADWPRCRYRRDQHRRIADDLRADDAGEVAA